MVLGGAGLTIAGIIARRFGPPKIYAEAIPTMNGQLVENETRAIKDAFRQSGLRVRVGLPPRFTGGRGAGAGSRPRGRRTNLVRCRVYRWIVCSGIYWSDRRGTLSST